MLKKIFIILPLIALAMVSCKKEEDLDKIFSSSPEKLSFSSTGGKLDVSIYGKNFNWKMTIREGARSWCSFDEKSQVSEKSGVGRTEYIPIYAKSNNTREIFRDTLDLIEVNGKAPARKIALELKGQELTLTTADSVYYAQADGSLLEIAAVCNFDSYELKSAPAWLSTEEVIDNKIKLTFKPNTLFNHISGQVEFVARWANPVKDTTLVITIIQDGIGSIATDSTALVNLYNTTAGASWKTKWNTSRPMTEWYGVEIAGVKTSVGRQNRVVALNLSDNNLVGDYPSNLGELNYLSSLRLNGNSLTGAVSSTFNSLTELNLLWLSGKGLTGTLVASDFDNIIKLKSLSIIGTSITGAIPAEIAKSIGITSLQLANNDFTGGIPSEFATLKSMVTFTVNGNQLTGAIPNEFKRHSYWIQWDVDRNIRPQQNSVVLQ